jgi:pimeloyl-ACP methyl ester carboxylesterase
LGDEAPPESEFERLVNPNEQELRVTDRLVSTVGGRSLLVQEGGDPSGQVVVVHLGTPSSRLLYRPHLLDAADRGIRLIAYDRPGYGGSSPHPGRTIADCAGDVGVICDVLGIERFAVWGISGGGPHALACAGLLADRVVAAATLASTVPFDADDLDWFAGAGQENVDDDRLILSNPAAARAKLEEDRLGLLEVTADDLLASHETLFSPIDAAALTPDLLGYFIRRWQDGLAPGIEGWWDDGVAQLGPWGFSPETIRVPVMVCHGRLDRMVPFQHGQWLARHLPSVTARLTDQDGHLTLLQNHIPAVHTWLLRHF